MIAGLSISGAPLFNGFISKGIISAAAGDSHYYLVKFLLILASVGTFLSVGIKLPYYTWFHEKKTAFQLKPIPPGMMVAMAATSFLCIFYGIFPNFLYKDLPYIMDYTPFTIPHLVKATQILIFTFLGFWVVRAKLTPKDKISLDTDWFFRASAPAFRRVFMGWVNAFFDTCERLGFALANYVSALSTHPAQVLRTLHLPKRDFDPDLDRPALDGPIALILLVTVLVAAWNLLT